MSGNQSECSESSLKLGAWALRADSPGTEQAEVELPSLMYSWKSQSENPCNKCITKKVEFFKAEELLKIKPVCGNYFRNAEGYLESKNNRIFGVKKLQLQSRNSQDLETPRAGHPFSSLPAACAASRSI